MNKNLLIGGAGLAGIAVLYLLMRENSQAAQTDAAGVTAPEIRSYPTSGFQPAPINIQEAPLQLVYNQPIDRNPPVPISQPESACGCKDQCDGTSDQLPYISPALADAMINNMKGYSRSVHA